MNPTYQHFATHDESEYPHLWRGVVGAWAPCLGPSGLRLHDHSGRANWGTMTNMDAATDWLVDGGQYALEFTGTDTAGGNASQNLVIIGRDFAEDVISFSAWVRMKTLNKRGICTSAPLYSNPRFGMSVNTDGTLEVYRGGYSYSTLALSTGSWQHLTVNSNGSTTSYFINGRFSNTASQSALVPLQASFVIGNNYWGALEGFLDDVQIRNREISSSEITELYQIGRGGMYTPRRRRRAYSFGPSFLAAWARGSNVILQPCGVS